MLSYFLSLSDEELDDFIKKIPCTVTALPCEYKIKNKSFIRIGLRKVLKIDIYAQLKTDEIINIEDASTEIDVQNLLITEKGIFNNRKFLFFKRKRREDIEATLIDFLVEKEKQKKEGKNIKKFTFGRINY